MTDLNQALASLAGSYQRRAVYFLDSDCVEYVREDTFVIYERVDDFLTLLFDETKLNVVGFKLKGFKHVYDAHVKPLLKQNPDFVELVGIIESRCTDVGNALFPDDYRNRAYKAASMIAKKDDVKLESEALQLKLAA